MSYSVFVSAFPERNFSYLVCNDQDTILIQGFGFAPELKIRISELLQSEMIGDQITKIVVQGYKPFIDHYIDQLRQMMKELNLNVKVVKDGKDD